MPESYKYRTTVDSQITKSNYDELRFVQSVIFLYYFTNYKMALCSTPLPPSQFLQSKVLRSQSMDKSSLKLNFRHCVVLGGAQRGAEYYDKHEPGVSHGIIFKHSKYDKTDKLLHTHSFFSFFIRNICNEEL